MTTNFVLGDFIIQPGLTENSLIGKRKRAARPTTSTALKRPKTKAATTDVVACCDPTGILFRYFLDPALVNY